MPGKAYSIEELKEICRRVRVHILNMTYWAKSGHPGGSLSATEILVALWWTRLKHDVKDPFWPGRDRFVLSKGHCTPILYAIFAERGIIPKEELKTFRQVGSRLQGHPAYAKLPAVEASTGTLGQGLSTALGMALALKLDRKPNKVWCMLGDGESQEGQVWEAAMAAAHYKANNLIGIVDYNKFQIDGNVNDIMSLEPLKAKWEAFGWNVAEIDAHDWKQIFDAFDRAEKSDKPFMIVANTLKGAGVSFTSGIGDYHGKALNEDEMHRALKELGEDFDAIHG